MKLFFMFGYFLTLVVVVETAGFVVGGGRRD